ncbi:MAG: hypothetical protein RSB24_07865, partial [Akkermansia sp.]
YQAINGDLLKNIKYGSSGERVALAEGNASGSGVWGGNDTAILTVNSDEYTQEVVGTGKIHAVIGTSGGTGGKIATIKDISLTGTAVVAIPEPTTATMALFALASLLLRKKRS